MVLNFFNKYPYTDFHELNLDWLLDRMRKLEDELNEALETLSKEIFDEVMSEINPKLKQMQDEMTGLQNDFTALRGQFEGLDKDFDDFTAYVNGQLLYLQNYVDAQAVACNEYTNTRIAQNNDYILSELTQYLSQIKVINFFTGELVSVQDMFDYLATLHTTDNIDYDTMALRAKTYTELAAFNKTYTDLVMNGNTWYV